MLLLVAIVYLFSLLYNIILCDFAIIYFSFSLLMNIRAISSLGHMFPQCISTRVSMGYIPKSEMAGPIFTPGIMITYILNQLINIF